MERVEKCFYYPRSENIGTDIFVLSRRGKIEIMADIDWGLPPTHLPVSGVEQVARDELNGEKPGLIQEQDVTSLCPVFEKGAYDTVQGLRLLINDLTESKGAIIERNRENIASSPGLLLSSCHVSS